MDFKINDMVIVRRCMEGVTYGRSLQCQCLVTVSRFSGKTTLRFLVSFFGNWQITVV